jgi:hypothetical protein
MASQLEQRALVDHEACRRVADIVSAHPVPYEHEDVDLADIPMSLVGNFFLSLIAICHQTSPVGGPRVEGEVDGVRRFGWDYLLARYHERASQNVELLAPSSWARVTAHEVAGIFHDRGAGGSLTDVAGRAGLLRDLGEKMLNRGWTLSDSMLTECDGRIATGDPNLLSILSGFQAYRDPIRKKSFFFLAVMRSTGLWHFRDTHSLGAPIDYHEVRGHLRLGTVRIADSALLQRVKSGSIIQEQEDLEIRQAVFDATTRISQLSGLQDSIRLHYLLWNLFRAVCMRESPRCFAEDAPTHLPERYRDFLVFNQGFHCPFEQFCANAHAEESIPEPRTHTTYY